MNENAVEVKNLFVKYGDISVLEDINVNIPEGAYVAVVGPNGSGKTTFLKTLLGLVKQTSGDISIYGNTVSKTPWNIIGYVPQIKTLDRSFPARSVELVVNGLTGKWKPFISKDEEATAMSALETVGAASFAKKKLSELSGGQLQRVYLARAFVRNPKVLLLDEPATGVDLVCETGVNSLIEEFNIKTGAVIIMVTHDWSAAYHHTKYSLLLNKNQIFFGPTEQAFNDLNLQRTFSHLGHAHKVKFGIKNND